MNTAVQVALAQPWLEVADVCLASATDTVTHCKVTATTRQANAIALTTLKDHTASPAYRVTMETQGKELFTAHHRCKVQILSFCV